MTNPAEPSSPNPSPTPAPGSAAPPEVKRTHGSMLLVIVAAGMMVGAIGVVLLRSSGSDVPATARPGTAVTPPATAPASETTSAVTRPKWSGAVRRSNGRNVAVYELEAENDVALWNKVVRPVLTVRCVAGTTEVFVLTQSAAAIDGDDGKNAVRIGYDGDPDASERWLASDEYDALFAENGVQAARRIGDARTMRFGFTPYNAAPVVARFNVAGFDAIVPKLARTCRW